MDIHQRADWGLVKKNAFPSLLPAALFDIGEQYPNFWQRFPSPLFCLSSSLLGWLYICIPKCHRQPWNPFVFVVVVAHAVALYCTPPRTTTMRRRRHTIVSTFHKTLTFPKAFLTWTTLLVKPKNYQIASDLALQYALLQSLVNVYKKEGGKTRKSLIEY